ncbi:autotransporter domain-containing protein [Phascolarctobacterium sp.]
MMNKKVLTMAVLAAVCGMAAAPVWAENRGGHLDNGKYVGDNGAANNKLLIDTDFSNDIISGLGTGTDAVKNNSIEMSAGIIRGQLIGGMSEGNGDIASNSITISSGGIGGNVYGAYTEGDGAVTNNSITMSGATVNHGDVYGVYTKGDGAVTNNSVIISDSAIDGVICGAYTEGSGAVTNNKVIISGDATDISRMQVSGGLSMGTGTVAYNSVTVTGGTIRYRVLGGGSANGIAEYNSVIVEGGVIGDGVTGGAAMDNAARHNSVTISGTAEIRRDVMGGTIEGTAAGDVTDNSVIISGGSISGDVYGAYTKGDGAVTNNSVIISGAAAEVIRDVFGAMTEGSGAVAYNSVKVTDGLLNHEAYGGVSTDGIAEYNSVKISGGTINMSTYGGGSIGNIARYNSVTITGGTVKGSVAGGLSEINAIENKVWISGGSIGGDVYGANNRDGSATGNEVVISGTPTFDSTYDKRIYGSCTYDGEITGNKVTISGAPVFNISDPDSGVKIYGGYVENDGSVTGNSVEISGDMNFAAALEIYGGYSGSTGAVTGNSVTISGRPTFTDDTVIYGGYSKSGGEVSGNILNIKNTDIIVSNIKNFDVYNFYLPDTVQAGDVLLTVTGGSTNEQTDLTGSSVNVGIAGSAPALQSGDNVTLLHNANGVLADDTTVYGKITQGVSLEYDFTTVLENGDSLVTTITRTGISDDTKSLVETQAAAVGFINSGADLLAGSGITSMSEVASAEDSAIFGAMSGGSMRYDTGSHADVKGYNFALGMGKAVVNNAGKLTFGPFVEYGYGDYTSYLDNGVRGDGKTKYYGVGVLARQDNTSGVYYEGSLRYGRMDADYVSNDLGPAGVHSSYDSSSAYYGAHLGIGKVTELNDTTKADVYAKLLYTHQNGDSVTLQGEGNGEVYDFDAVDSTRARVGARVSKAYSERGTGYVGLAYEYEFDGEARATVKGFSTPSPSIQGSSGLLELGYILQPKGVNDPTINIGLQGWGGKKQGVTGNVNFVWTF